MAFLRRRIVIVPLAVVLALGLLTFLVIEWHTALSYAGMDGCRDVPTAAKIAPQVQPTSYLWPYGSVQSCRVIGKSTPWSGSVDVSFFVILETDRGPVLARIDYVDLNIPRRYVAAATELSPASFHLSADEARRIENAIVNRGGLQKTPWIVHYGDG